MFSTGQLFFAIFFVIAFVSVMIWTYRKDAKIHQKQYGKVYVVFLGFTFFIVFLFLMKYVIRE